MSKPSRSCLGRILSRATATFFFLVVAQIWTPIPQDGRLIRAQEPEHMYTNKLIDETSPYLLQHAHNPVDWYPWGEEAFAKAKRENKPVFLSVGYSTCYWCHVMEVESFEDPEVAAVINKYFVAIKVDREERPDIDEQYMLATQLMTGRGGWPNSVWLTPDGRPWMAGTYFPKPRFVGVLRQINEFWVKRRDDVIKQADALETAARRASVPPPGTSIDLSADMMTNAASKLLDQFDSARGGFGGAPKFPPHGTLDLLIEQYRRSGDKKLLEPITKTLDAMWLGGIHDHLGGGFHRYATDAIWLLPHFEKMLYDNAQLMRAYADAYEITGEERYRVAVGDIYRWVEREMTSPAGAFYSALDSGEVGKEGEAYVWSMEKLMKVLGEEDGKLFAEVYHFLPEGNFEDESTRKKTGENIPHLKQPLEVLAQNHPLGDQLLSRIESAEKKLLDDRLTWPQPHKDDKVLTSWNGLMIEALARAGRILEEPKYTDAATRAADFILDSMVEDGVLLRSYRAEQAKLPGYLDDYAFFCKALLELNVATEDQRWLEEAARHVDHVLDHFIDEQNGGFFFTGDNHESLVVRSKNLGGGGNMPNTNGVFAQVLLQMHQLTGEDRYRAAAKRTLESLAAVMSAQPHTTEHLLIGVSQYLASSQEQSSGEQNDALEKQAGPVSIRVRASKREVAVGGTVRLNVDLMIDDGWHLYAASSESEFVKPATISVQTKDAVTAGKWRMPKPDSRFDAVLKSSVDTYVGDVKAELPITIDETAKPGQANLVIVVETQACDDMRCLEPQKSTFSISLEVLAKE